MITTILTQLHQIMILLKSSDITKSCSPCSKCIKCLRNFLNLRTNSSFCCRLFKFHQKIPCRKVSSSSWFSFQLLIVICIVNLLLTQNSSTFSFSRTADVSVVIPFCRLHTQTWVIMPSFLSTVIVSRIQDLTITFYFLIAYRKDTGNDPLISNSLVLVVVVTCYITCYYCIFFLYLSKYLINKLLNNSFHSKYQKKTRFLVNDVQWMMM